VKQLELTLVVLRCVSQGSLAMEHEREFLGRLISDGHRVVDCSDPAAKPATSLEAIGSGADFVYQARLQLDRFTGYADFLACQAGDSSLGSFHYEVWDTKIAKSAKAAFIVQLCAYTEMLEALQSRRPQRFQVVLGTGEQVEFATCRFLYYYRSLKRRFLEFQAKGDNVSQAVVLADVIARDARDASRTHSPLVPAQDAHLLDTSNLSIEAAFHAALSLIEDVSTS
jgi:predicted RecB family nuclease